MGYEGGRPACAHRSRAPHEEGGQVYAVAIAFFSSKGGKDHVPAVLVEGGHTKALGGRLGNAPTSSSIMDDDQ